MTLGTIATLSFLFKAFALFIVSGVIGQTASYYAGKYFIDNGEKSLLRMGVAFVGLLVALCSGLLASLSVILNVALFIIQAVKA